MFGVEKFDRVFLPGTIVRLLEAAASLQAKPIPLQLPAVEDATGLSPVLGFLVLVRKLFAGEVGDELLEFGGRSKRLGCGRGGW